MRSFLTALQFLTVIPAGVRHGDNKDMAPAITYFPFVGMLIGLLLIPVVWVVNVMGLNELALNSIIIVALIVITGGLHLDGLADTVDAISSGKPKDEMLKIMRDPHIGTMGVLALFAILLLKLSFLSCVPTGEKIVSVILMCVLSRWSLALVMSLFPYARAEGKARLFMEGISPKIVSIATLITIVTAVAMAGLRGIVLFAVAGFSAYLTAKYVARKIGGITGDTLGAISELMEVVILFCVCLLYRG